MNQRLRTLTLLHSNDLHGDFLAEELDDRLLGGKGEVRYGAAFENAAADL